MVNIVKDIQNHKKLSILVSLDGFWFCITDLKNKQISNFKEFIFLNTNKNIEQLLLEIFNFNTELNQQFDQIIVLYLNNLNTFVPFNFFDKDYLGSYLQYNIKIFDTDFVVFDELEHYQICNVYIPYININNFFIDKFGTFDYKHAHTVLISKLLPLSKNFVFPKMYVHIKNTHFEIIIVENQKLIFFNTFEYKTPEDLIYFILFTAEQLHLNPENVSLELLGNVTIDDELYKICFKFIRHVSLLHVNFLRVNNFYPEVENIKHFILFSA